jgi:spore germination protein GerM
VRRPRGTAARTVAVLLAVVLTAALGGCGITTDDSPRPIPQGALPEQLILPATTTTITVETVDRTLYFALADAESLATLSVPVPATEGNPYRAALSALVATRPVQEDLNNQIPPDTAVLAADLDAASGVLTVNLSEEMEGIEGELLVQAFAQLVFTATEFRTVTGVRFLIEGQPRGTPIEGGIKEANETVDRSDYRSFDPTRPTTTSTTRPAPTPTTAPAPA